MAMEIRAGSEDARRILAAAAEGDVRVLRDSSPAPLSEARCSSGCTALHWASGSDRLGAIDFLVGSGALSVDVAATRKARGRTPLHYACRNGCLEAAKRLVQLGADPDSRAKHDVSPFQLAVWQNHLAVARWLVEEHGVDAAQANAFDCCAVHWLGICPLGRVAKGGDGSELVETARWLAAQPNVDFTKRQRQGHTALHKAAWGGHVALLRYLRDDHGLWDDTPDHAGNFAADLARMANTDRHARAATFLREECSSARAHSCAVLDVDVTATRDDIRRAYLAKARLVHPDRNQRTEGCASDSPSASDRPCDFQTLQRAYQHLTLENGVGTQCNPAHSIKLMLKLNEAQKPKEPDGMTEDGLFSARLVAVLLEYGDKGIELCNIRKKWKQVWPDVPFPQVDGDIDRRRRRKGALAEYLSRTAGHIVDLVEPRQGTGSIIVVPKHCTRAKVEMAARKSELVAEQGGAASPSGMV